MKSTALVVLVALLTASDFGVNAIQNHNVQRMETETLTDKKKNKKTTKAKKHSATKKDSKTEKSAKKEEPKEEAPKEESPEDETDTSTATEGGAMSGADEDEIIDKQFNLAAKEAMNAAGVSSGEKVVFKEDAIAAGKKIIR
jgi:cytoskeletal protein RodZ|tara:strand:- start:369 stop:794 length:426 start_codon:yes stop_codon:yes gene_type:complete